MRASRVTHARDRGASFGRLRVAQRLLYRATKRSHQGDKIMFRRLSVGHILTAGLIGLAPACGSGASEDAASQSERKATSAMPSSVAASQPELTSVKPSAPAAQPSAASESKPVEPEVKPLVDKAADEVLDRMTFEAERKPNDVRLRVKLARALLDAGKIGEARSQAERAVEVDEQSPSAWHVLGRVEMAERDFVAAATSLQRVVEKDPDNSHAWNSLGYALIEQGKYEDAAAAMERATSGANPAAYMWNNLGMAYEHLDRIREARAAYRQAASAGSTKGQMNLQRLEGVRSLRPSADTPHDAIEEAREFYGREADQASVGGPGQSPQEQEPGC
jgi:Flp pilus assembly protein TadD